MKKAVYFFVALIISSIVAPTIARATTQGQEIYDGQYYHIEQVGDSIMIKDKSTGETATMEMISDDLAIFTNDNGESSTLTRGESGEVYLNNEIVQDPIIDMTSNQLDNAVEDKDNNLPVLRSGTYHYFQTTYSNTHTDGTIQSIALGIFSFMPYVGWIATIAGVVEAFKSLGQPIMYTKTDHYYIDGYSKYKYITKYYSNSSRTKLVRTTTLYKSMW